uniref:Uncharacterized protein n=1 Tax=Strigamia maritima TaxID=126957 RepID=T1JII8_STRMM
HLTTRACPVHGRCFFVQSVRPRDVERRAPTVSSVRSSAVGKQQKSTRKQTESTMMKQYDWTTVCLLIATSGFVGYGEHTEADCPESCLCVQLQKQ